MNVRNLIRELLKHPMRAEIAIVTEGKLRRVEVSPQKLSIKTEAGKPIVNLVVSED